ncbi:tetratricopeptide repeat protein [Luteibacter rhizovicinus]|uniref:tetratricopeptide repeat protein n=1 Tax=Luteibacter rhizovicinus TaxID=242606 RepID=UPI0010536B53|nr:C-type cytochrome biogenesis protein [Luteibacter rhizovicinus]
MSIFYIAAAAMIAVALCLIVYPLLRRRPSRSMLAVAIGTVAVLPVAAIYLYSLIGTPSALDRKMRVAQVESATPVDASAEAKQREVAAWMDKAHAAETARHPTEIADAYRHVLAIDPEQTAAMVGLVEAGMSQHADYAIDGPSRQLLQEAVALEPDNQRALWLLGIVAFQQNDYPRASQTWRHLLSLLDADSSLARTVAEKIAVADARTNVRANIEARAR